jgi:enoyl-CoA hydratase
MTEPKTLKTEQNGGIATVTISRPEALNALNADVLDDLRTVFDAISADDAVLAVVLTGEGKAFVAGADIAAMSAMSPAEARAFMKKGQDVFCQIEALEKPVIAAVNGFALGGGCELAMACDVRFASEKAKFGQPEVGLGIIPGFGGTQRLPRLVGAGNAKYLIFGAETIDAQEALRIGLVQKVCPPETLLEDTLAYARLVLEKGPVAVRMSKAAIAAGLGTDIRTGCAYEAEAQAVTFATDDAKEGLKAFTEKRKPTYTNR